MTNKDNDFINKCWFGLKKSWYKHPILWNIGAILVSLYMLCVLTGWFLGVWTHHGQNTIVPNVIGMDYRHAVSSLQSANLKVVVSDSVYRKDKLPGSVVDVVPCPNATVKAGREVYITIVAFSAEPIMLDANFTDMSYKQAESILKSLGLKVQKRYVPYQYDGLVVNVKCNGRTLGLGSRVTVDDLIILEVGQVPQPVAPEPDPLDAAIDAAINASDNGDTTDNIEADETTTTTTHTTAHRAQFGLKAKTKKPTEGN